MKLIYNPLGISFELVEDRFNLLVIENNREFEKCILNLNNQILGIDENFFTNEENPIFFKRCKLISSPFDLEISDREIQKSLYCNLIEEIETTKLIERLSGAHAKIIECIDELSVSSEFDLDYDENFVLNSLLKSLNVRIEKVEGSFVSRFIEYARITNKLLGKEYFILANCTSFFNDDDYFELFKWARYNSISILLIENQHVSLNAEVNECIIDKDLCELH